MNSLPASSPNTEIQALAQAFQNINMNSGTFRFPLKEFKIHPFDDKPEHTIKAFFQQFERATTSLNYSDVQKISALPIYLAEKPRQWFEAEWEIHQTREYSDWKILLMRKYFSENYEELKRAELSQKILKVGDDVDSFFDEMMNLFQEIDPLMPEKYEIAEIKRAINNIPEYRKFLAVYRAERYKKSVVF